MSSALTITHEELALSQHFIENGVAELRNAIVGEEAAKEMFIAGLAMGDANVVLIGPPGGGKSTLIENAHRIIDGIDEENIAYVPHRADLTAAELVGESARSIKSVTDSKGLTKTEIISADLQALLNPNIQAAIFDEITRANPHALNAALGILAKRRIVVDGKRIPMKNLELVASGLNPAETMTASFKPTAALSSRQTMGTILGANNEAERDVIQSAIWDDDWQETPELIIPVLTLSELHTVRGAIGKVLLSDELKASGKQVSKRTINALADDELHEMPTIEADGRLADKLKRITRTLALLRGRTSAGPQDLHDAVHYSVTGRLGFRGTDKATINRVVDHIYR